MSAFSEKTIRLSIIVVIALVEFVFILFFWNRISNFVSAWDSAHPGKGGTSLKDVVLTLVTLASAPIALFIWHWRDANNLANIEIERDNHEVARGDLLLKDFHQIEQWATDGKTPTLQLAAIHQLLPFAKGENGRTFVMPAQEIYRSLLKPWHSPAPASKWEKSKRQGFPDYIDAIHEIVRKEYQALIKARGRNDFLYRFNLSYWDLSGADLSGANLSDAWHTNARFHRANLIMSNLAGADLAWADLRLANLNGAWLMGADLSFASLEGTTFILADLSWADLSRVDISRATLKAAKYNDDTKFPDGFNPADHGMKKVSRIPPQQSAPSA